ncbi:40S ribosomal protein S30-like [Cryptotermes secundus]|uniref:40S ribosomal protein S30-like n=1 Tax=Cryptotermes secundus TaxID=105785 RepID=UPI000CD7C12E|nr:40S ribosomal protein S30-like [Cryptotermes secundus]
MQLLVQGQGSHVIDCEGSESVGQIRSVEQFWFLLLTHGLVSCALSPSIGGLGRLDQRLCSTRVVDKQEKKNEKTGRAKRSMQCSCQFVNVVQGFGCRSGPNAKS